MSIKILGIGDPHLESQDDIGDEFYSDLKSEVNSRGVDYIVSVGDVVDQIPDDRDEKGVELGRAYFEELNEIGLPILSVGGNHEYDIQEQITEGLQNVYDVSRNREDFGQGENSVSFIGRGADQFNLYPELDFRSIGKYDDIRKSFDYDSKIERLDLEESLDAINLDYDWESLENYFEVEDDYQSEFRESVESYQNDLKEMVNLFSETEAENKVFIDHLPPFNTSLDVNKAGDHRGSITGKKIILDEKPGIYFCGHLHDGGFDFSDDGSTGIVKLGKREVAEVEVEDNMTVSYEIISEGQP